MNELKSKIAATIFPFELYLSGKFNHEDTKHIVVDNQNI